MTLRFVARPRVRKPDTCAYDDCDKPAQPDSRLCQPCDYYRREPVSHPVHVAIVLFVLVVGGYMLIQQLQR